MWSNIWAPLRSNARLRWGVLSILAIAWLYGILVLRDELHDQQQQYTKTSKTIARLEHKITQQEWLEREQTSKTVAVQLESRLWQAATPGLAQAALQDWLGTTLAMQGLLSPVIDVSIQEESAPTSDNPIGGLPADLIKVKAKVNVAFSAPQLMQLLHTMYNYDKTLVIHSLVISKEPTPRAEIQLFAYFQKPTSTPTAASTTP